MKIIVFCKRTIIASSFVLSAMIFPSCKPNKKVVMTSADFALIAEIPEIQGQNPSINVSGIEDSYRGHCVKIIKYKFDNSIKFDDFSNAVKSYTSEIVKKSGGDSVNTKMSSNGKNSGLVEAQLNTFVLKVKYARINDFEYTCEIRLE